MTDRIFINQMVNRGKQASEKVKTNINGLSPEQLNWKPAPESWSVAQCLDHLIVADCLYFPAFEKIVNGNYSMTSWQKWSPLGGLFGKMLVSQLQEHA